jgi:hypothetical protein
LLEGDDVRQRRCSGTARFRRERQAEDPRVPARHQGDLAAEVEQGVIHRRYLRVQYEGTMRWPMIIFCTSEVPSPISSIGASR